MSELTLKEIKEVMDSGITPKGENISTLLKRAVEIAGEYERMLESISGATMAKFDIHGELRDNVPVPGAYMAGRLLKEMNPKVNIKGD